MPTTNSLSRQQNRTRTALMSATVRLTIEMGYDNLSITAIAKEADYTRRAFYLHFKSVDDAIQDICVEWYQRTHNEIFETIDHLKTPEREYAAWLKWVEVAYKNRQFALEIPSLFWNNEDNKIRQAMVQTLIKMLNKHDINLRDNISKDLLIQNELNLFALIHNKIKAGAAFDDLKALVDDHFRLIFNDDPPHLDI